MKLHYDSLPFIIYAYIRRATDLPYVVLKRLRIRNCLCRSCPAMQCTRSIIIKCFLFNIAATYYSVMGRTRSALKTLEYIMMQKVCARGWSSSTSEKHTHTHKSNQLIFIGGLCSCVHRCAAIKVNRNF